MIVYFANRNMEIMGKASAALRKGVVLVDDKKSEDVETGIATFECSISVDEKSRKRLEVMAEAGNYLLKKSGHKNEFYTIIDSEVDTKKQEIWVYAEDAGLDLLNEIAGEYAAEESHDIEYYVNYWTKDSGFEIGINECPSSTTRTLSWDGESTVTERLASIATQFDGYEISYSFDIKCMEITHKYINIHKQRGKDIGVQLRLNRDIDRIITKKSVANLATAFRCVGGTPEDSDTPITLKGYSYDDGDFFVGTDGGLRSRNAAAKWSRYVWNKEPNKLDGYAGHIWRNYSYDTTSQQTLCSHAITELKKVCDMEVNYEVEISKLRDGVEIGDRVNIIDDVGELYLSSRILKLSESETRQEFTATIGEHLIKGSGISQKVSDLAAQFAEVAQTSTRAYKIAETALSVAGEAQTQADAAAQEATEALAQATEAKTASDAAAQTASEATAKAEAAGAAVDVVEQEIVSLEESINNAEKAAENARQAAETAQTKADEAHTAATNAQTAADEAKTAADEATSKAESAETTAGTAKSTADQAISEAQDASATATAAKEDAAAAQKDIDALGEDLTTLEKTMRADYARKTDLTEATASLRTQITQNAEEISSTASKVTEIDETANNAAEQAAQAQSTATAAQTEADKAKADAAAAQTAADEAKAAATTAQSEADTAKAAAETAQSVADKAAADLKAAEEDLATVQGRVDATEEDIAAAQEAVNAAQTAADNAKAEADAAAEKAATAQNTADTAASNATAAQTAANNAADKATAAQAAAEKAQGDATAAQVKADEAAAAATAAQNTADQAKADAATAQTKADDAAQTAADAQQAADDADAKAAQAAADLVTAQQNLADVTSRVDATEEEVAAAQAAVDTAQAAADKAKADAAAAQATADTAKANAATAQTAADNAKTAADNAQAAADAAQEAADKAQADVDALVVRMVEAETKIVQNAEQIALMATKTEVTETLGGYYTKEETESLLQVESDNITSMVSSTYATKGELDAIEIGGRNLLLKTDVSTYGVGGFVAHSNGTVSVDTINTYKDKPTMLVTPASDATGAAGAVNLYDGAVQLRAGETYTYSCMIRSSIDVAFTHNSLGHFQTYSAETGAIHNASILKNGCSLVAGEWTRASIVFEVTADCLFRSYLIYFKDVAQTINVCELKLEKGNKATDWTPAPEDMATSEDVDNVAQTAADAQTTAADAEARVTSAESVIQQLADAISMIVVDDEGTTLLEQTSEGWSFNLADVTASLVEANAAINSLNDTLGTIEEGNSVGGLIGNLEQLVEDLNNRTAYIDMKTDDAGNPYMELGKRNDDEGFKLAITNSTIDFKFGSAKTIQLENRNGVGWVIVDRLVVDEELWQGNFVWLQHNGNLGLLWKEVIE